MQAAREYFAGRTDELDAVLDWAEAQIEQIPAEPDRGSGQFPMLQCLDSGKGVVAPIVDLPQPVGGR